MNANTRICPCQQSGDAARQGRSAYVFALVYCCLVFLASVVLAADAAATNGASGGAALSEISRKEITALIQQLGFPESAVRTRAKAALKERLREAVSVMVLHTNDADPEIRISIQELVDAALEEEYRKAQELLTRGKQAEEQARDMEDRELSGKAKESARVLYLQAAEAFEHAARDFSAHTRAHQAALLAGQCRMQAEDWDQASRILTALSENKAVDAERQSQNLYWLGDCNVRRGDNTNAFRAFKRLVWDYPESSWAKYARGRLSEPRFSKIQGD